MSEDTHVFCAKLRDKLRYAGCAEPERETDGAVQLAVSHGVHSV